MKRAILVVSILVVVSMLFSACGPTPEPQVVEVEKIVTQEVEKIVTQVVEVEKIVTQEVEVEKIVTQEVEVEKLVTAEPEPLSERERTLIMTYPFEPSQIDPHAYFEAEVNLPYFAVYEGLFRYAGPDGEFTPQLAESFEWSDDGMTLTFKLREGAKFHDGSDFNAETAKWNFDRLLGMNLGPAGTYAPLIDSVEVVDDYTLALNLTQPTPGLEREFGGNWAMMFVCPGPVEENKTDDDPWAHEWYKDNMCGTGPYQFASYEHGQQLVIEKNEDYWGGWDHPGFDKMIERIVPESSTQRMLLEGGEIDLTAMPIELEDIKALMQEKGITCRSDPTILFYMISLKYTEAGETGSIMSNPKVRQALSYAFNYDSVLENILGLKGTPIKNTIFLPSLEGYDPDAAAYTFDLDKARELLAEAGYPDGGFDLDLMWLAVFPEFTQIAELYQSDLAKLGINLTIHGEQPATFIDQIASPDTTPDLVLRPRAPSNLSWSHLLDWTPEGFPPNSINEGYYDNAEFNQLVEAAKGELDPDARAELIRQAVQVMHDDPAGIWIASINDVMCFTDTLGGLSHEPHYLYVYWPHDLYREQ